MKKNVIKFENLQKEGYKVVHNYRTEYHILKVALVKDESIYSYDSKSDKIEKYQWIRRNTDERGKKEREHVYVAKRKE